MINNVVCCQSNLYNHKLNSFGHGLGAVNNTAQLNLYGAGLADSNGLNARMMLPAFPCIVPKEAEERREAQRKVEADIQRKRVEFYRNFNTIKDSIDSFVSDVPQEYVDSRVSLTAFFSALDGLIAKHCPG